MRKRSTAVLAIVCAGLGILLASVSGCSVNKPSADRHRKAHIAMHNGNVAEANKMAKRFGGDHQKAHIFMHKGDKAAAHHHASQQPKSQ